MIVIEKEQERTKESKRQTQRTGYGPDQADREFSQLVLQELYQMNAS